MNRALFITWLKWGCLITGAAGLLSFAASVEALSGPWLWLFDLAKWPLDRNPASFSPESMTLNAILGGVLVSWAMILYYVAAGPIAQGNVVLARQMLLSILTWFGIDSVGSYLSHVPGNIILNLVFLALLAVPLWMLSQERKAPQNAT